MGTHAYSKICRHASGFDLGAWILLLLLPLCTLKVNRSRTDKKYGKKKCCQVEGITRALRVWKEPGGPETLVKKVLKDGVSSS